MKFIESTSPFQLVMTFAVRALSISSCTQNFFVCWFLLHSVSWMDCMKLQFRFVFFMCFCLSRQKKTRATRHWVMFSAQLMASRRRKVSSRFSFSLKIRSESVQSSKGNFLGFLYFCCVFCFCRLQSCWCCSERFSMSRKKLVANRFSCSTLLFSVLFYSAHLSSSTMFFIIRWCTTIPTSSQAHRY